MRFSKKVVAPLEEREVKPMPRRPSEAEVSKPVAEVREMSPWFAAVSPATLIESV